MIMIMMRKWDLLEPCRFLYTGYNGRDGYQVESESSEPIEAEHGGSWALTRGLMR